MQVLTIALVALPLLAGVCLLTMARRARPAMVRCVMIAACCGSLLCALWLALHPGDASSISFRWLPGWGLMGFELGATGLYATIVTIAALLLALLHGRSEDTRANVGRSATLLLAMGAANAAFLADHFVLRYVALEIVALCIPLAQLAESPRTPARLLGSNYVLLRFGDAGMLLGILLLLRSTGTLHISSALAAAESLPINLDLVAVGFVIAIWVKLGIWPLHVWHLSGRELSLPTSSWLYTTVASNLGLYLLYRVSPLLAAAGGINDVVLWLTVLAGLISALYALLSPDIRASFSYAWSAVGCAAFLCAIGGLKSLVWLYIPALTLIRLLLHLTSDTASLVHARRTRRVTALIFGAGGLGLAVFGQLSGIWLRTTGIPAPALIATRISWGLLSAWLVLTFARLWAGQIAARRGASVKAVHWQASGIAGLALIAGAVALPGILRWLAPATHLAFPAMPTVASLAAYAIVGPILWDSILAAALIVLSRKLPGLIVAWQRIQSAVPERDIAERATDLAITRSLDAIRAISQIVERQVFTNLIEHVAQWTVSAALWLHRNLEEASLEGALRNVTQLALALAGRAQRLHTGRLRMNLAWVTITLGIAVLAAWFWAF